MIERFRYEVIVLGKSPRDGMGLSERFSAFLKILAIGLHNHLACSLAVCPGAHGADSGIPQVVRLSVLMNNPGNLVGMLDPESRKFHGNHTVYGAAVGAAEVEQAPEEHAPGQVFAGGVPLERQGDDVGLMAMLDESLSELRDL